MSGRRFPSSGTEQETNPSSFFRSAARSSSAATRTGSAGAGPPFPVASIPSFPEECVRRRVVKDVEHTLGDDEVALQLHRVQDASEEILPSRRSVSPSTTTMVLQKLIWPEPQSP